MIVLGIILICAGAASYIYGEQLNNNIGMQLESLFNTGSADPGSIYVTIGIVVAVIGLIFTIIGIIKKFQRPAQNQAHCPYCGATLANGAVFCGNCGNKVENIIK